MGRLLLLAALALTQRADGRLASSTGHAIEAHTESKVATKVHAAPAKAAAPPTAAAPAAEAVGKFDPGADYKKRERPPSQGPGTPPTSVFVNLDIHQLYGINPLDGTASVEARLELKWNDTRLYGSVRKGPDATPIDHESVWVPKMTFSNQAEEPATVASLMTLDSDGQIIYRRRLKVRAESGGWRRWWLEEVALDGVHGYDCMRNSRRSGRVLCRGWCCVQYVRVWWVLT